MRDPFSNHAVDELPMPVNGPHSVSAVSVSEKRGYVSNS